MTSVERAAKVVERDRKRDRKCAEKEAEDEAQRVAKIAERDRKRTEKEEEEAQCVAKAAAKADDALIVKMITDDVSFSKIASKLGNGLSKSDIYNRWNRELKKSSGIIEPALQVGQKISITWTADVDAMIVRMRAEDVSFSDIASKLGNGLKKNDNKNRWNRHLKDKLQ